MKAQHYDLFRLILAGLSGHRFFRILLTLFATNLLVPGATGADYHLDRITPILNQPTFVTQAIGDPTNILYYTTRISSEVSGFNVNTAGKVWRYDVSSRISTPVLDFSTRQAVGDEGLFAIAIHPDFNNPSSTAYGKIYASTAFGSTAIDQIEEFIVLNPDGSLKTTNDAFATARLILRYTNNTLYNHTIGWIGFDPHATNAERNYLYISTGDGSYGNGYSGGVGPTSRPSQNPNDLKGKILRVDISGGDDYPDTNKNFAIPPTNPIPAYNADTNHTPIPGLGEVYVTGIRNGYRVTIDRANGDLYWGDVGETSFEELDFLKSSDVVPGPPPDFGWPQFEGVHNSTISGAPHGGTNPFYTNIVVTCRKPLREWPAAVGHAAIGGHVYRGPIPELQGKYFYDDFVSGKFWMLEFDRDTDPATFNGSNGIRTDITVYWNTLVSDPLDSSYRGDTNLGTINGLDHVASYGEDTQGNVYLVDLGYGPNNGDLNNQYRANAGEIFKLVPGPVPPPSISAGLSGTNILLTWTGPLFKLQAQTNNLDPNGWADYPNGGASPVNAPLNSTGAVYFRLKSM